MGDSCRVIVLKKGDIATGRKVVRGDVDVIRDEGRPTAIALRGAAYPGKIKATTDERRIIVEPVVGRRSKIVDARLAKCLAS